MSICTTKRVYIHIFKNCTDFTCLSYRGRTEARGGIPAPASGRSQLLRRRVPRRGSRVEAFPYEADGRLLGEQLLPRRPPELSHEASQMLLAISPGGLDPLHVAHATRRERAPQLPLCPSIGRLDVDLLRPLPLRRVCLASEDVGGVPWRRLLRLAVRLHLPSRWCCHRHRSIPAAVSLGFSRGKHDCMGAVLSHRGVRVRWSHDIGEGLGIAGGGSPANIDRGLSPRGATLVRYLRQQATTAFLLLRNKSPVVRSAGGPNERTTSNSTAICRDGCRDSYRSSRCR